MSPVSVGPHAVRHTLSSGLQVLLVHQPGTAGLTLASLIRAGWRHDPPQGAGTAHLVEHLLTVGARLRPLDLATVGADFDARSYPDHLEFITHAPASIWRPLIDLELERVQGRIAGHPDDLARQRAGVLEEIRALQESSSPWPELASVLHRDTALGHEGFGTLDGVEGLTSKHCHDFVTRFVRPDRALLLFATDLDAAGGADVVLERLDQARKPRPETGGPASSDSTPESHHGPGGEVTGTVQHPWSAWAVPGLARDAAAHLRFAHLAACLAPSLPVRFGRSGPGRAGDCEDFVLGAEPQQARQALTDLAEPADRHPAHRWLHDPVARARIALLGDTTPEALARIPVDDLSAEIAEVWHRLPAVVLPGAARSNTGARFSTDQQPAWTPPPARDVPTPTARGQARRRVTGNVGQIAVFRDGATALRARVRQRSSHAGWSPAPDLLGHRAARSLPTVVDTAPHEAGDEPLPAVFVIAVGEDARAALGQTVPDAQLDTSEISPAELAAEWVAVGAINELDLVVAGDPTRIRAMRVAGADGAPLTLAHPDSIGTAPRWTPQYLERVRRLCLGQLVTATSRAETEADLLLTLRSLGLDPVGTGLDLTGFALLVEETSDTSVHRAAQRLLAAAQPLPQ